MCVKMNFQTKSEDYSSPGALNGFDSSLLSDSEADNASVLLINEVKKYPILYDFNQEKYSDKDVRAKIWTRISEDLGITATDAKHQWKRLRDSLRDALKRQEGKMGVGCRKTWRYHKKMEFVVPFMTNREPGVNPTNMRRRRRRANAKANGHPHQDAAIAMLASGSSSAQGHHKAFLIQGIQTSSGLSYPAVATPVSINLISADGSVNTTINTSNNSVHNSCHMPQRSLNVSSDGTAYYASNSASTTGAVSRQYKDGAVELSLLEELAHKPLDEDLYFCLSMAASMKRLSEQRRARLKCDMMSMLYTAQCEESFP